MKQLFILFILLVSVNVFGQNCDQVQIKSGGVILTELQSIAGDAMLDIVFVDNNCHCQVMGKISFEYTENSMNKTMQLPFSGTQIDLSNKSQFAKSGAKLKVDVVMVKCGELEPNKINKSFSFTIK